jgi:hypothetical protein
VPIITHARVHRRPARIDNIGLRRRLKLGTNAGRLPALLTAGTLLGCVQIATRKRFCAFFNLPQCSDEPPISEGSFSSIKSTAGQPHGFAQVDSIFKRIANRSSEPEDEETLVGKIPAVLHHPMTQP